MREPGFCAHSSMEVRRAISLTTAEVWAQVPVLPRCLLLCQPACPAGYVGWVPGFAHLTTGKASSEGALAFCGRTSAVVRKLSYNSPTWRSRFMTAKNRHFYGHVHLLNSESIFERLNPPTSNARSSFVDFSLSARAR